MRLNRSFAVVITLALMAVGRAGATCSTATLTGNFGFVLSGMNSSLFFTSSMGLVNADGKGGLTGTETISNDGNITSSTVTGSVVINANCSGTVSITPSGESTQFYSVVVDSKNTQLGMVQTNAGYTVSGYALAQGTVTCTLEGLKGVYAYYGSGWNTTGTLFPTAISGEGSADGLGNLKGLQTASLGGTIVSTSYTGTYTVNSDCTGTTTTTTSKGVTATSNNVLVNNGRTLFEISTATGTIEINVGQKQ